MTVGKARRKNIRKWWLRDNGILLVVGFLTLAVWTVIFINTWRG